MGVAVRFFKVFLLIASVTFSVPSFGNALASERAIANVVHAMTTRITRAWKRPPAYQGGLEMYLRMALATNGELVDVRVVKSSGDVSFDRAALTAVQRAAPFVEVKQFDAATFEERFRSLTVKFRPEGDRSKSGSQPIATKKNSPPKTANSGIPEAQSTGPTIVRRQQIDGNNTGAASLWDFADLYKPKEVSNEQFIMALYDLNPEAFEHKNLNTIKLPSEIMIPSVELIAQINRGEAVKRFNEHMDKWRLSSYGYNTQVFSQAPTVDNTEQKILRTDQSNAGIPEANSVPSFSADYQKGIDAYNRGDYEAALREFRPLAEQGVANAQYSLGSMYRTGRGVAQSEIEAVKWYRLSAEQGNASGQNGLGFMYRNGRGVAQSDSEALKWYRKSAEQGNSAAQGNLGGMYEMGRGVTQSDTEAVKWYRKSADQGRASGQNNLGRMYEMGRGVAQSNAEAIKWFRLSAEQGNEWAQNQLRQMGVDWTQSQVAKQDFKSKSVESITLDDSERVKALEERLAKLEAEKEAEARSVIQDSLHPTLQIAGKYSKDATGFIEGRVSDNVGVVELLVNGQPIAFGNDGRFTHQEYLPTGGKEFTIVVVDRAGLKTTETVRLNREASKQVAKVSFDSLNPTTRRVKSNTNAIALIVGVAEYSKTAPAEFADKDAQVFYDYANLKLGIPKDRIQTLINDKADEVGLLSGINKWLKRSVKQGESDVYIFFAGHGLASDDGDTAYLIPYDGAPDFLERTAISRDEVFREVSSVNPRSVTVFLDTCYSGDTRGETRLIAGRPLSIKLQEQSLPKGFTVLTAAGGDQIAKPLKEAQHGMFSYFLMKGMEGGADSNSDNQITARELHTYVRENVVQQSGGSQVPELQGDAERVLVRFR